MNHEISPLLKLGFPAIRDLSHFFSVMMREGR